MDQLACMVMLVWCVLRVEAMDFTQVLHIDSVTLPANHTTTPGRPTFTNQIIPVEPVHFTTTVRTAASNKMVEPGYVTTVGTAASNKTDKPILHVTTTEKPRLKYAPYIGVYQTCFDQKGCFGFRDGCVEDETCTILATYTHSAGVFTFELLAFSQGYVAVAFSDDENMGNDGGVICYKEGQYINVTKLWNFGPPGHEKDTHLLNETVGLLDVRVAYEDGWIACGFTISSNFMISGWTLDLLNKPYFLMVSSGAVGGSGEIRYHGIHRTVMSTRVVLRKYNLVESLTFPMVKYHAAFMILAWIGLASTGVLFSRYMKNSDWLRSRVMAKPIWFVVHQGCMISTCLLSIVALSLILAQLNGWTTVPIHINPHAALGCTTMSLLVVQVLIASTRFKWKRRHWRFLCPMHWVVGHLTHIFAITTCFFGIKLGKAELPSSIEMIMSSYVVVHCLTHIVLTVQKVVHILQNSKPCDIPHEDMSIQISAIATDDEETCYSRLDVVKEEPKHGAIFHQVVVSTYLIVVWILTVILVVVVSAPEEV